MRGDNVVPGAMFSFVTPAQRVPQDHPLRAIKAMTDAALKALSADFDQLYSRVGRPSIPPERLLRASLLQYLYGIRSERLLMEQLDYNLLFRWFVGLEMDDLVWDASTFSKNRERLLSGDVGHRFLEQTVAQAKDAGLTSDEHFSVDGDFEAPSRERGASPVRIDPRPRWWEVLSSFPQNSTTRQTLVNGGANGASVHRVSTADARQTPAGRSATRLASEGAR